MSRGNKLPSYRLHKPSGQAVVRLDGKDHYLGAYGTPESRRRYEQILAEWLAARTGAAPPPPPDGSGYPALTVSDVLARYWQFAETHYVKRGEPTRQLGRVRLALGPVRDRFGNLPAAAFGPKALKEVLAEYAKAGWTRGFCNACLGCVKRSFKWAVSEEMVPPSVWHGLAAVSGLRRGAAGVVESGKVRPVAWETVEATLPELLPAVADMVRLQHLAGMRPCEVCGLRVRDIRTDGRVPDGPHFSGVWVYVVPDEANKTAHHGHPRLVFFGPKAQEILRPYLDALSPDDHVFSPRRAVVEWLTRSGRQVRLRTCRPPRDHYGTDTYDRAIASAAKRAGVPRWSPNRLRHSRATELRQRYGLDAAGATLGHHSLTVTMIYAEEDLAKAAQAMLEAG
ncbi:MAG: site-specific integrase [Gemmataceae bacterium]|nr:site-specific integrase [Gemmataceae bacterium]